MTHVVNLLPWRDLRRRQRLRYVLLLTIGIVLLGGMGLLVSRTARLQRDFLATLHTTADAQLLASLKQREQAMREAWQQHQRQRQQYQRRSAIAAWQPRLQVLAVAPAARNDKPVSLVIDDAPVAQVLQALAEMNHKNLVVAPDVSGTLSLRLQKVPWSQALRAVADSAGLSLQQQGTVIYAHTQAWQKANQAQREAEQEKRLQNLPLQAESVTLHFADAEELAKSGGKLLSARGHLMADKRTNRLLIRDDARHLPALKAWAQEMDLPVGQVELAAHIVSMSETSLRELGVKWRLAEAGSPPGSGQITTLSSDVSVNDASTRAGFNIGKINGRLLELELSALERKQQVEIIASPRLLASHMQPASIKQGSEIPYQVSSGESGATSVEFKEAVLGMEVTPTVLQQGRVRLKLRISENTPGQVLKQENGEALAIDKQEIETLVEVRSGETLALGGIFSQKNKTARDSVPLLGDIPVLGRLFRRDGKDNERRELVVFITPRILAVR
ncbi:DNA uptake porin HofQ [Klebsiella pneumoniae]